jgi:hypothetical protein
LRIENAELSITKSNPSKWVAAKRRLYSEKIDFLMLKTYN